MRRLDTLVGEEQFLAGDQPGIEQQEIDRLISLGQLGQGGLDAGVHIQIQRQRREDLCLGLSCELSCRFLGLGQAATCEDDMAAALPALPTRSGPLCNLELFFSKNRAMKGYDGVKIDNLAVGIGVGRPSLYAIVGDKRAIFLRVLAAYAEAEGAHAAKALLAPQSLRDSLASFLKSVVQSAMEEGSAMGCLLVSVAPLVNDAKFRQVLLSGAAAAVGMAESRVRDAISSGEISFDFPVAVRASQGPGVGAWP